MAYRVEIEAGDIVVHALLSGSATAEAVAEALPLEGVASRWGDEIYFAIPVALAGSEDSRTEMAVGELGYWPTGSAFCIFFGPTPVSRGAEPRAYSEVNPFGQVEGDATILRGVSDGQTITVRAVGPEAQ